MNKTMNVIGSLMYLLDPERGRRRRTLLRDKLTHYWHKAGEAATITATDVSQRVPGKLSETMARFRREEVSDPVLVERVRAKLGRVCSHPRAIHVSADQGRVTLTGPILTAEVDDLLKAVASVRGVRDVTNQMEAHATSDNVPALQGGRPRPGESSANWSPTSRLLASTAGCAMASYGAKRRDPLGAAVCTMGVGLMARGLTNMEMKRLVGLNGGRRGIDFQKTIHIAAPVDFVFPFWSHYENFPRWMSHVREVRDLGAGRSHWVVAGPAGIPFEWDAELTEFVSNRVIAWKSVPGAAIAQEGIVRFDSNSDGTTRIDVKMTYNPPAGAAGHVLADLLGADPKAMMDQDLARMKTLIETGNPPHDAAQPDSPARAA
jgi:uncharacterized membrane protein